MNESDPNRELLYRLMAENRDHARLSEDRRIVITGVVALAATATCIAMGLMGPGLRTVLLALWLAALGAFGTLACLKLYERAQFHEARARSLRNHIEALSSRSAAGQIQDEAGAVHAREHPRLSRLRFNSLLVGLNLVVLLLGLLYVVLAIGFRRSAPFCGP